MTITGIKGPTGPEGALRTWEFGVGRVCKDYVLLLLFLSRIHEIKTGGFIMQNEDVCQAGWAAQTLRGTRTHRLSVHLRPGFSTGSAAASSSHHQGEQDPCQVEQAIYSVRGGWDHPRWVILSFPQSEPDLKEGPVLKS